VRKNTKHNMNTVKNHFVRIRHLSQLPFFCHPVHLFVTSWILMLATLEIQVSWSTFPDRSLGFSVFFVSVATMLLGFLSVRRSNNSSDEPRIPGYFVRTEPLRKSILVLGLLTAALVVFNYVSFGLPPIASFFGFSTLDYQEYGRFKQALEPITCALFLNSLLEPSRWRRWFWSAVALGVMLAYVLRGPLLMALIEAVILASIRSSASKRKIYFRAAAVLLIALTMINVVGNYRTPQQIFLDFMEIKPEFRSWPMALLWPITYISVPVSNLCWIIHGAHFTEPTLSFLYPVLPSFWAPDNPHEAPLSDSHIIDGVHTYLANYFLDFSWIGIAVANFALGLLSGFLVNKERISRYPLLSPVLLAAMSLIFFWDFFVYLPTLGQLGIQAIVQRLCIVSVRPARESATQAGLSPAT
jgi:oligosaccharide repeat unit polymerase